MAIEHVAIVKGKMVSHLKREVIDIKGKYNNFGTTYTRGAK
jgi:hypothetical protein